MSSAVSLGVTAATPLAAHEPQRGDASALRWARFLPATHAEGPGQRAAVWTQGCSVHCPGCFNPQLWTTRAGVRSDPVALGAAWARSAREAGSEGLTILGGEPFDQADAAATVAEAFRAAGMSVMVFSGYTHAHLREQRRADIDRLLAATDLLCDGPYLKELPETHRPWIGSQNQSIRALTEVYAPVVREIDAAGGRDRLEVRIHADGGVEVNGWATDAALAELFDDLGVPAERLASRIRRTTKEHAA